MAESKNIVIGSVAYGESDIAPLKVGKYIDLHTKGNRFVDDIKISVTAKDYDGSVDIEGEPNNPGEGTEIYLQEKTITENGEYTADSGYDGLSKVTVDVPIPDGYIVPSGTKEITANGVHNVTEYADVNVSVPVGVFPSGTKDITANGTYDVSNYASVSVNVPVETVEEYDGTVTISGSSSVSLISFTIDGTSYQAEDGMTWGEWVESDYNTGAWVVSGDYITDGGMVKILKDGSFVRTTTLIIANATYSAVQSGGSDT